MTVTMKSQSSNRYYFVESQYRRHTCKHMRQLDEQLSKSLAFAALRQQYDYRSETQREIRRAAYLNYELSIGVL